MYTRGLRGREKKREKKKGNEENVRKKGKRKALLVFKWRIVIVIVRA